MPSIVPSDQRQRHHHLFQTVDEMSQTRAAAGEPTQEAPAKKAKVASTEQFWLLDIDGTLVVTDGKAPTIPCVHRHLPLFTAAAREFPLLPSPFPPPPSPKTSTSKPSRSS